jgi:hypothetical protein
MLADGVASHRHALLKSEWRISAMPAPTPDSFHTKLHNNDMF